MDPDDLEPEVGGGPSNKSRILWTFSDQALSSLTNFALVIVVAKSVDPSDFGSFSLAMVTFTFLIGLGRSLVGDPYVVRFTDADRHTRRRATRQASGAAVSFGVIGGLVCIAAALVLSGQSRMAMLALGISMPGLMLQENWRHIFFAEGRARAATINDGLWTVIQFALIGVLLTQDRASIFLITMAWGISALAAGLFGIIQARVVPDPFEALAWYRETRELNVKMGLDFAFNQGATTLVGYLITAVVGTVGIGAIRAAQSLLGPLNLLFAGISAFGMPVLARAAMAGGSLLKQALALSTAIGIMASTWVAILIFVPDSIGAHIMGDSWNTAHEVMLPMGIITVTVAFVLGASLGLKALRRADQMLRVTFMQAPLMLGLGALGGAVWSIKGAAWGMCIAQVVGFVACWFIFLRSDRLPRPWIDEENEDGPAGNAPEEFDRGRRPESRSARDRFDADGFWSQEEQDRWALEESEQLYSGQQAEESWDQDERHRRAPSGRNAEHDPRQRRNEREGETPPEGWYDPQEPTVAVRHDPRDLNGYQRPQSPSDGVYDPHEPTIAVRNDRNGYQHPQSPSDGVYDPQEPTVVARSGRQRAQSPSGGLYDPQEPTVVARPALNGRSSQPARPKFRAPWEDEESTPQASRSGGYDRGREPQDDGAGYAGGSRGRGSRSEREEAGYAGEDRGRAARSGRDEVGHAVEDRGRGARDGRDQAGYAGDDRGGAVRDGRDQAGYAAEDRGRADQGGRNRAGYSGEDRGRGSRGEHDQDAYGGERDDYARDDRARDTRGDRDPAAYDQAGHTSTGPNQPGRDRASRSQAGRSPVSRSQAGYDHDGYDQAGYNQAGYDQAGYNHDGYDQAGYDQAGYNQAGYDQAGYNQAGYNQAGYNQRGYDQGGYDQGGHDQAGYDRAGYDQQGHGRDGRTRRRRDQGGHPQGDQYDSRQDDRYAEERPDDRYPDEAYANERQRDARDEPDPWPFPEQGQGRRGR